MNSIGRPCILIITQCQLGGENILLFVNTKFISILAVSLRNTDIRQHCPISLVVQQCDLHGQPLDGFPAPNWQAFLVLYQPVPLISSVCLLYCQLPSQSFNPLFVFDNLLFQYNLTLALLLWANCCPPASELSADPPS